MFILYGCKLCLQKYRLDCFLIFAILFTNAIVGCSLSSSKETYNDANLGISFEMLDTWELKKNERVVLLDLIPTEDSSSQDRVSVKIFSINDEGKELLMEFEDEIERVKRTNALDEVELVQTPNKFSINNSEAISATIMIPIQLSSDIESREPNLSQPMDLIVIRGNNQLIVVHVRKSNTNILLNAQANDIVKSIRVINGQ